LNTVARPPAEHFAMGVPPERLKKLANLFRPRVEVIAVHHGGRAPSGSKAGREAVLALLRRRPCLVEDVAHGLGLHLTEALKLVTDLEARRQVVSLEMDGRCYYRAGAPGRSCRKTTRPRQKRKGAT
jgi:hypothetical protein